MLMHEVLKLRGWLSDAVDFITHYFILAWQRGEPCRATMLAAPPPRLAGGVYMARYRRLCPVVTCSPASVTRGPY